MLGVVALCAAGASAQIEMREYLLGDVDGINYNGPGSVDDVYIDPDALDHLVGYPHPVVDFDIVGINQNVPFTFEFPLAGGEEVVSASLTMGLKAAIGHVSTDALFFYSADGTVNYGPYYYEDIGWLPVSLTGVTVRSIDLSNVLGDDLLFLLADGQLTCQVRDDAGVDFARLTFQVEPPSVGDFDSDGDVDADDIDLLCDNLGDADFDLDGDGDADEDDLVYLVENLVELQDGSGRVGTAMGDFNLDGLVNATDGAVMKSTFGTWPRGWADGNANCDDIINATDRTNIQSAYKSSNMQ